MNSRFKLKAFSLKETSRKAKYRLQNETVAYIKKYCKSVEKTYEAEVPAEESQEDLIWQEFDLLMKSDTQKPCPTATAITEIRMYIEEPYIGRKENPIL